jgi:ubiquinone/menaquinone biosynthesis C-methylase UbiE
MFVQFVYKFGATPKKEVFLMTKPPSLPKDQRKRLPISLAARSNLFPLTAKVYDTWRSGALSLLSGRSFPIQEELEIVHAALQPVPAGHFLDLGCSTGLYAKSLLEQGAARVYGLDLSLPMLKEALRKTTDPRFVPLWARAEAIPLADASLDGIAVGGSWNEFLDPRAVVQEMYRVLKPGGRIFIMFTHRSNSPLQTIFSWAGLRFLSTDDILEQLQGTFTCSANRENSVGFVSGKKILPAG